MKKKTIHTSLGATMAHETGGKGRSIVFLHGNSMNAETFLYQLAEFGDDYHCVALDFPGHGEAPAASDPRATYGFGGFDQVLRELHSQLELRLPVYVGQSLGGHLLLEALPDLAGVAGAVLVGSAPFDEVPTLRKIFLPDPTEGTLFRGELDQAALERLTAAFLGPRPAAGAIAIVSQALRKTDPACRARVAESLGNLKRRREIEVYQSGRWPLAVTLGKHDRFLNADYFQSLGAASLWKGKVHFFSESGHLPHLEQPAEFNVFLRSFIHHISQTEKE